MGEMKGNLRCTFGCWTLAALAGALGAVLVGLLGGFNWPQAVFVGAILAAVIGVLLTLTLCGRLPTLDEVRARTEAARGAGGAVAPGQSQGHTGLPISPTPTAVPTPAAVSIPAAAPAAVMTPLPATAPVVDDAAVAAAGAGTRPVGLPGPRGGAADDLRTIEGIGPVLEKLCHEMGIFHFDQIAGWGAGEVAWMNGNLKGFKGRVGRDKWVAQARLIGEVGIEEFRHRAKTNDY